MVFVADLCYDRDRCPGDLGAVGKASAPYLKFPERHLVSLFLLGVDEFVITGDFNGFSCL